MWVAYVPECGNFRKRPKGEVGRWHGGLVSQTTIGVYWGARPADLASCAARATRHFQSLSETSPYLDRWYLLASRKPKKLTEVDVHSNVILVDQLAMGVNRTDIDRKPIPELGWRIRYWNGDAGGWSASTDVHCGMLSRNPNLSNCANVSISGDVPDTLATELLRLLVGVWNPDTGVVTRNGPNGDKEVTVATYATSMSARIVGRGERHSRGRLVVN